MKPLPDAIAQALADLKANPNDEDVFRRVRVLLADATPITVREAVTELVKRRRGDA